jgi:hypothetical protein
MKSTRALLIVAVPALMFAASVSTHAQAERGKYIATLGHCNDCHTPMKMGDRGPEPDMARMLSGHPESPALPPAPAGSGPWIWAGNASGTAFAGPWGVSFTANLTPDQETGLGAWTEQMFIDAMRRGRHQGKGRPLLPPMPYKNVAAMTDADLKALFAYLRSIPAVRNRVPEPIEPADAAGN